LREFQLIITRNPESSAGHAGMGFWDEGSIAKIWPWRDRLAA
jgi:hypothetical protein